MQAGAVAVAEPNEGARPLLQHVGEVFGAHPRRALLMTLSLPAISPATAAAKAVLALLVHQHRIAGRIGQLRFGAVKPRRALDHLPHPLLQQIAHPGGEAARGAAQLDVLRDDVVGVAALEHADRDDRGLERVDVARHDRLQLVDDLSADQDRVDAVMRPCRVPADAFEIDGDSVGRGHHRARGESRSGRPASPG